MIGDKYLERAIERIVIDDPKSKELILLRCKLEMRTMFVRVLTAILISTWIGVAIQVMKALGVF